MHAQGIPRTAHISRREALSKGLQFMAKTTGATLLLNSGLNIGQARGDICVSLLLPIH